MTSRRLGTYGTPSGAVVVMLHAVPILRVELNGNETDPERIGLTVTPILYTTDPDSWPVFEIGSTIETAPGQCIIRTEPKMLETIRRLNHRRN